jgi:glutaredoxin
MKITIYTITDCQYSKQEKDYLAANNLQYEEKNLETNKEFLTEMMAISNNFAGTPVTRVEKDDGSIAVLKGFTKEEFDTTFGFKIEAPSVVVEPAAPAVEKPVSELNSVLGKLEEQAASDKSAAPTPPAEPPVAEPPTAEPPAVVPTPTPTEPTNTTTPPSIPDFPDATKTTA